MRIRSAAVALALFIGAAPAIAPSTACAAPGPHAVLVVDTEQPGGQYRFCVALPDGSVSGTELIELAGEQHGLQYRFGYGGQAVCELAGVGTTSDDCFERYPQFWGYWRSDDGSWEWSGQGAGSTTVRDGDVEGWSWGSGNDGSTHPQPPETAFGSVCDVSERPSRDRPRDRKGDRDRSGAATSGATEDADDPASSTGNPSDDGKSSDRGPKKERNERERSKRERRGEGGKKSAGATRPAPTTTGPSPSPIQSPVSAPASDDGPPVGGLIALAVAFGWIVVAAVITRRRKRGSEG